MKITIYAFSLLLCATSLLAQKNFEGVIIYHRKPSPSSTMKKQMQFNSGGVNGVEKVFFKGSRMKREREFYGSDTLIVDVSYYDFDRYPNSAFGSYNGGEIKKKNISSTEEAKVISDKSQRQNILGFDCYKAKITQESGSTEKYLSTELRYSLPEGSQFNGFIVSHLHDFIPLKRIENYKNPFTEDILTIEIEAVLIFPKDLPDSIFEVDEGEVTETTTGTQK